MYFRKTTGRVDVGVLVEQRFDGVAKVVELKRNGRYDADIELIDFVEQHPASTIGQAVQVPIRQVQVDRLIAVDLL